MMPLFCNRKKTRVLGVKSRKVSKVTIQTSVFNNQENAVSLSFLDEYAAIFGSAIRTGFSVRNKIGTDTNKTKRQLESDISKQLELKYGLSSTDAIAIWRIFKNKYKNLEVKSFCETTGLDYLSVFWFFRGCPVEQGVFKDICKVLEINWQEVSS